MSTKAELIATLATKFYKVATPVLAGNAADQAIREKEGVRWYIVGVYDKSGDTLVRKNLFFYVKDEGQATEEAYPQESLAVTAETFTDKLKKYLDTLGLLGYSIGNADTTLSYANVTVFAVDGADANKAVKSEWLVKKVGTVWSHYTL